ncbi:SNF2 domain-containing protein ENL1 isoform X1 [Physcomitrium patens]|uniref:SNF2 family DNA-dependent ATPase n=1 Tax=Physcomitrium patens TaxID=3218 RepID=A0A7I4D0E9_PHYPA|nr:protein CHROMATIN REMODELING 24-like isoform X1 [Physcomitrium patens]|eukprot:XP_024362916.1 protein CHROMATIN REMODELING 24-like isoform X1 [Physcomitrella patens]
MGDNGRADARPRREAKSAVRHSKAELLQAIAARRQAQLLRSINTPSRRPDEVLNENGKHFYAEARKAASMILPESSDASELSGDDVDESDSSTSPAGSSYSNYVSDGRGSSDQRLNRKNSSSGATAVEDLSSVLDQISLKDESGGHSVDRSRLVEKQFERKPKDLILNIRKQMASKSTIVDLETDSEDESFASLDPAASSPSVDYTSADDGDVDSPFVSKTKSKINQPGVLSKTFPSWTTQFHRSSNYDDYHNDDDDAAFVSPPKIERRATAVTSGLQSPPATHTSNEGDRADNEEKDMVLIKGKHRFTLRAKIANMLYPHQRKGLEWFWSLHTKGMGGILGDDMGLGKTLQVASFLAGLFCTQNIKCALIVAPKTLIAHWVKELKVVGLSRKTQDYSGTSVKVRESALSHVLQMGGVLLTTYDMVRCNFKALRGDYNGRDGFGDASDDIITWDYIILDEGHLVKNPNTQRAKSLRAIPAAHRIVISGTPIQNHLQEMWALFDFCCPNLLGDRKEFREKYERQILAGTDKNASDRQKRIGIQVAEELRQKFAPYFLRRLKSEVFPESNNLEERKLSKKNDLIVWLPLSKCQERLYRAFLNSNAAEETLSTGTRVLSALTVMKKICDHPSLLTKRAAIDIAEGMEGYLDGEDIQAAEAMTRSLAGMVEDDRVHGASCKIDFLMALLENLVTEGHRTLIFAQTRKMLDIIQDEILDRGWIFRRIDGTIKAADREQCVQEFQSDNDIPLFLLTSQVGGLGLTLTGANRVVIVDPAWNPSTDNQSVDRAYRIGQKKNVVVYRLMTCGTIEEKIYRKQVFKGHLMKVATEKKNQMRYFSQGELGEMFKVPEAGFRVSLTQQQLHKEHFRQYKIDEELGEHIHFLAELGIAGVSHHDLLFTKAEPLPPPGYDEDEDLKASWEPRNSSYVEQHFKAASKSEKYVQETSQAVGRSILSRSAPKGLQPRSNANDNLLKVQFLRSKLERLYRTLDDKALLSRVQVHGTSLDKKINETEHDLREAELIAGNKENIAVQWQSLSVVRTPVVDLSEDKPCIVLDSPEVITQRPKPLGINNNLVKVSPLPDKKFSSLQTPPTVRGVKSMVELPNWSLLSDSPATSHGSPAPTSRLDIEDMSEALS